MECSILVISKHHFQYIKIIGQQQQVSPQFHTEQSRNMMPMEIVHKNVIILNFSQSSKDC